MDAGRPIAVSPRHTVLLAGAVPAGREAAAARLRRPHGRAPRSQRPAADGRGAGDRERGDAQAHPAAATYPLHFRKTYFPGRLHEDPAVEFERHLLASELVPNAAAHRPQRRRVPQLPDPRPVISRASRRSAANRRRTTSQGGEAAAGDRGGVVATRRGDAGAAARASRAAASRTATPSCTTSSSAPSPLEPILIDFEAAVRRDAMTDADWEKRCKLDLEPLLREAVYLQCALGRQPSRLGELSWSRLRGAVSLAGAISARHRDAGRVCSSSTHFTGRKELRNVRDTCATRRVDFCRGPSAKSDARLRIAFRSDPRSS